MKCEYGAIREWGLDLGEWNLQVGNGMTTNIPGVFAAGDFVAYENKVELIAGTFTSGILALNSAKQYMLRDMDDDQLLFKVILQSK
ncbi:hypothetical protein [Paenibacillus sp. NPDC055715]